MEELYRLQAAGWGFVKCCFGKLLGRDWGLRMSYKCPATCLLQGCVLALRWHFLFIAGRYG